jgi:hypothetical protein
MIHQLRIYEIFEANKDAFHARFRDHAARIIDAPGRDAAATAAAKQIGAELPPLRSDRALGV